MAKKQESAERIKNLETRRDALIGEYRRLSMRLSDLQDQISDVEGDIRMIENESEQKRTRGV